MGRASKSDKPVFNRIQTARRQKGYSRRQFAGEIGVHYQTIGYLERGEFAPSLHMALKLSEVLNIPISDLFSLSPFDDEANKNGPVVNSTLTSEVESTSSGQGYTFGTPLRHHPSHTAVE